MPVVPPEPTIIVIDSSDDEEVNNHHPASPSHEIGTLLDDEDEIEELDGDELLESLCLQDEHNSRVFKKFEHAYDIILKPKSKKEWEVVEKNRGLGYNGLSKRSRQRHERKICDETQLGKELKEKRSVSLFFVKKRSLTHKSRPVSTIDSFFPLKNKPQA